MKIVTQTPSPMKKTIKQIIDGEAFRIGYNNWYIRIDMNDECISNFGDFYDSNVLQNIPQASSYDNAIPCLHLDTQCVYYANGEVEVDEWGKMEALITTAS